MSLRRREFCATLAGLALAPRIISKPTVHAFCEDETIELKPAGALWSSGEMSVSIENGAVHVSSPQKRLLRLRLHWPHAFSKAHRYLGDAWERSYGDLGWRPLEPERIFPWYFLAADNSSVSAWGVKTNPGAFCFWQVDPSGVTLWLDLRNGGSGVDLGKRTLLAATIVTEVYEQQSPFQAARKFCRKMADRCNLHARPALRRQQLVLRLWQQFRGRHPLRHRTHRLLCSLRRKSAVHGDR